MNRRQKLVQQQFLNNEAGVIRRLDQVYGQALKDIDAKIEKLMERFDPETGDLMQSAVYQIKYQKLLKAQIEGILQKMQTNQYLTVSDYLNECYEDGFIGAIFDQHGQGVPLMMPINQEELVTAVQLDSKISEGLYTRLGEDVNMLKKRITAQVSRGIATGVGWKQVAQQLANQTRVGYNRAIRIARTEGHRIQNTAIMNAAEDAKERGADLVKQWDATLDGKTRESHVDVDGEIRELNEKFSNGLDYPGDPAGGAAEVVNCRCVMLQRARWAVGGSFTKFNNFTKQLETFESPEAYDEFKKGFFSDENKKYMNYVQQMEKKYKTRDFTKVLDRMDDREYKHYSKLLANNPVYNKAADVVEDVVDDTISIFKSAAEMSNSPVEMWMNMTPDEQAAFMAGGFNIGDVYTHLHGTGSTISEWKPANPGGVMDYHIGIDLADKTVKLRKVTSTRGSGWMASADRFGEININESGLGDDWRSILAHEAGHQMVNASAELQRIVIDNPGDVLGRYNVKRGYFDGLFGEYNPEEAFATAISVYYNNPNELLERYPDAYSALDGLFTTSNGAKAFIDRIIKEYGDTV